MNWHARLTEAQDFKSCASTNFATGAQGSKDVQIYREIGAMSTFKFALANKRTSWFVKEVRYIRIQRRLRDLIEAFGGGLSKKNATDS